MAMVQKSWLNGEPRVEVSHENVRAVFMMDGHAVCLVSVVADGKLLAPSDTELPDLFYECASMALAEMFVRHTLDMRSR
jgi:hypothetical protein